MSDFKSKLPDLKELGEISGKLFKDLKTSISEIITTYKQKRPSTDVNENTTKDTSAKPTKKPKKTDNTKD